MDKNYRDNEDLALHIQVDLNTILSNSVISKYYGKNGFIGLYKLNKENVMLPMVRVRETISQVEIYDPTVELHDFIIAHTKDGYHMIEHKDNQYFDYFNKAVLKVGSHTSPNKCTVLNYDNLIGILLVLFT